MARHKAITTTRRIAEGVTWEVITGGVEEVCARLEPNSFDAMESDPPYGFNMRDWDRAVPPARLWEQVLRCLKPGAFGPVFGGPRTMHRVVSEIDYGGFEIIDSLAWLYAQGNPKTKNLLKPAHEPIALVQRPYSERTMKANVERWGCGTLNVEECRIEGVTSEGRWPANVILDDGAAAMLDAQSGERRSALTGRAPADAVVPNGGPTPKGQVFGRAGGMGNLYADSGGASRFFQRANWEPGELDEAEAAIARFMYCPKVSQTERGSRNDHVSVKPMKLTEYLARLVKPRPVDPGKILIPFCGSGSEMLGAMRAGWRHVVGIELDPKMADVARWRIENAVVQSTTRVAT